MKKTKELSIISFIIRLMIIFLTISSSFLLVKHIKNLDVLPDTYFIIFVISLTIFNVLCSLCLVGKKIIAKITGIIISILIIILSILGIYHVGTITELLDKAFDNIEYEVTTYSVVVLKNSDYYSLEDLHNKTIGCVTLDTKKEEYENVFKDKVVVELKEYDNSYIMYDDLSNKKVDSMVINDIYLEFLEDEDSKIDDKIKVIYNFDIKNVIGTKHSDLAKDLNVINILITGSDSRKTDKIQSKTRSDVNMIMTVNPSTHEILLTSIPRDYYVQLHGTTGTKDKLTHSGIYGMNMTKQTIEDLMNIKIDYIIKVGFGTVINVVDTIGGIDIYADQDVRTNAGDGGAVRTNIYKGWNHLSGEQALGYARERKGYKTGDNHRVQNQQQVLEAIFTKVMTDKSLLSNYEEVLNSLSSLYVTDIPQSLVKRLVKSQLNDMKSWKIEKQQLTGIGATGVETYSMPGWKLWVMIPNESSINKNSKNIKDMINGKSLSELGF